MHNSVNLMTLNVHELKKEVMLLKKNWNTASLTLIVIQLCHTFLIEHQIREKLKKAKVTMPVKTPSMSENKKRHINAKKG